MELRKTIGYGSFFRQAIPLTVAMACTAFNFVLEPAHATNQQQFETAIESKKIEFFERKIRPILAEHCFSCHSDKARTIHGGLELDSAAGLKRGGDSGPVVASKEGQQSLLLSVLHYDADIQMPPKGKLSDRDIKLLEQWVHDGAVFPTQNDHSGIHNTGIDFVAGREYWSFQPLKPAEQPGVKNENWPRQPLDWFVLRRMEEAGLTPAPEAGRDKLLRRLSFDLTGLPPSPEELIEFCADNRPDAYERLVDRLLSRPQFGERWARFWLDLSRYTDKTASWLDATGEAHLYRDWIVNAFNNDIPYDDFVRRQLATDMMESTDPEDVAALGFLGLSPNYWKELKLPSEIIKVIVADEWEERVDAVSRTFLGLTVACARCHDHKFDPISTEDYYAIAGVVASCRIGGLPTISGELYQPVKVAREQVKDLKDKVAKLKKQKPVPTQDIANLNTKADRIIAATPNYHAPMATGLVEESLFVMRAGKRADQGTRLDYRNGPRDLNLFVRGNSNRPGPVIPRGFLTVLSPGERRQFTQGSGRLELADAIVNDAQALTARVIVNRIWAAYFGQGIVTTTSNFGRLGDQPSHPDLLDDLAFRFVANDWSLKWLHREIVTSSTYRQTSTSQQTTLTLDVGNKFLSRMNRRRLSFEQWRDAMLAVSGELDLTRGGPATDLEDQKNLRRTIYATVHRREMSDVLLSHDFPAPTSHSPKRSETTTALQGLFALNGPLLQSLSAKLAKRLCAEHEGESERIFHAYQLLFARSPTANELEIGLEFLDSDNDAASQNVWQQYAQVLLVSNEFIYLQ